MNDTESEWHHGGVDGISRNLRVGLAIAVAILIPVGIGVFWGWRQQAVWPAAAAPFVYLRVLIVHLLCYLPISLWFAWQLSAVMRKTVWGYAAFLFAGLVALVALVGFPAIGVFSELLTSGEVVALRGGVSLLLVLPWCIVAALTARRLGWQLRVLAIDGLIALLILVLPVIHVQQLVRRQSQVIADRLLNRQYVTALRLGQELAALGTGEVLGEATQDFVSRLQHGLETLRQAVSNPLAADAALPARLQRAELLYSLEEFNEVSQTLRGLGSKDPRVAMRLALVHEMAGRWAEAAHGYQDVLELLSSTETLDDEQLSLVRSAIERRVNNLRRVNLNRQAERELREALDAWPQAKDSLFLQLGFHYQMAGRTTEAIDSFVQAVAANSELQSVVDQELAKMSSHAEGCMIRSAHAATR